MRPTAPEPDSTQPRRRLRPGIAAPAAALAAMFFYPLTSSMGEQVFYLHWGRLDSVEFALAFFALGLLAATALAVIARLARPAVRLLLTTVLFALPAASFAIHLTRQLHLDRHIRLAGMTPGQRWLAVAGLGLGAAVAAWPIGRRSELYLRLLHALLLVLSPLALLWALTLLRTGLDPVTTRIGPVAETGTAPDGLARGRPGFFVFVFDEMSYRFVYDEGRQVRDGLPALRAFADLADNYYAATSPGSATTTALPGLLLTRRDLGQLEVRGRTLWRHHDDELPAPLQMDGANLFRHARARGYGTAMTGWYYPYCQLMRSSLDLCAAASAYSFATTEPGFSPLHPLLTNLVLWPHQRPFGWVKNPIACRLQRETVAQTRDLVQAALAAPRAMFVFAHFSIPHVPFAFDTDRYRPSSAPYAENLEDYRRQLRYTDHLFGQLVAEMRRRQIFEGSTVVVLSDHDLRIRSTPAVDHIPLLVKRAGQQTRTDHDPPVRAEEVLRELLAAEPAPETGSGRGAAGPRP